MAATPTIVCLVETPGQFVELERLTRLIAAQRSARQIYLVYDCGDATDAIVERIAAAGAECANASRSKAERALRGAATLPLGLGPVVGYFRDLFHLPVYARGFRRQLRAWGVDLVVVAEDNVSGRSRALLAAAERQRIPSLLLPFTIPNPEEAAAAIHHASSHQVRRPDQRAFAALRPRWVRDNRGRHLLRLPLGKALMLEFARLSPPDPWIENRGPAIVAAESRAMQRRLLGSGVPEDQVVLTGSLVDAVLEDGLRRRDELRAALLLRFGLADRPLLLCALPPNQFGLGPPAECEYTSYGQLIAEWLASLKAVADRFSVVIRPHPRTSEADLEQIRQSGVAIALDDTASLIPLCDLYVASSSATIRWAIASARPVINYDVYRFGYHDYDGLAGVKHVETTRAFDAALGHLASSLETLKMLAHAQATVAGDWGCLDGGSQKRLLELYDRLLARR